MAAVVLFGRKTADWSALPLLLVLAVPCAVLYALGLRAPARGGVEAAPPSPWRAGILVLAILLTPLVLLQLVDTVGGDPGDPGHVAWVFALTAAVATWCAIRAALPYGVLLAGLAWIVAWLSFWDAVLADPSGNAFRWLLVLVALLLAYVALRIRRLAPEHSVDLASAAGVAGIAAGVLGVAATLLLGLFGGFAGAATDPGELAQHAEWDLLLLLVSLAMVVVGARSARRGPAYVGGLGLLLFSGSAVAQVSRLSEGDSPDGAFVGWPLILLVLAGAALAAGFLGRDEPPERRLDEYDPTEPLPRAPDGPAVGSPGWPGH